MTLIITGCGRSGTGYIARLLRGCGYDVRHEAMGRDGGVGWFYAGNAAWTGYGERPPRWQYPDRTVLHQVRHPLHTIAATLWMHTPQYEYINRQLGGVLPPRRPIVRLAMSFWLHWNRLAASASSWTYRVEALPDGAWDELMDRARLPHHRLPEAPRDIHHREHSHVTWPELRELDPILTDAIRGQAAAWGYQV